MVSGRVLSSGFDKFQEFGKADGKPIVVDAFSGTVELNAGFFTSMIFFRRRTQTSSPFSIAGRIGFLCTTMLADRTRDSKMA